MLSMVCKCGNALLLWACSMVQVLLQMGVGMEGGGVGKTWSISDNEHADIQGNSHHYVSCVVANVVGYRVSFIVF